jgi:hypothetical protein
MTLPLTPDRFPFAFLRKAINIQNIDVLVKPSPDAPQQLQSELKLRLEPGNVPSTDDPTLLLQPWNGLLRAVKSPAGAPGNWTLTAWQETGGSKKRLDPKAVEEIYLICNYTFS